MKNFHLDTEVSAVQLLKRTLDTFLAKDIKGWSELCDENIVVEFPFAPDLSTRKMFGRQAVYDYLKNYPSVIDLKSIPALKIYSTDDPGLAIAEWSASGHVIKTGKPYEMSYATIARFKDGLMIGYREYWNPMAFLSAMDGSMF